MDSVVHGRNSWKRDSSIEHWDGVRETAYSRAQDIRAAILFFSFPLSLFSLFSTESVNPYRRRPHNSNNVNLYFPLSSLVPLLQYDFLCDE